VDWAPFAQDGDKCGLLETRWWPLGPNLKRPSISLEMCKCVSFKTTMIEVRRSDMWRHAPGLAYLGVWKESRAVTFKGRGLQKPSEITNQVTRCHVPEIPNPYKYWCADKSLARPTSRCILFDGQNISFDASLVIYINSTNITPIVIINRIYETQNLLSL